MSGVPTRVFSLAEANEVVSEVADLTRQALRRLEEIRHDHAAGASEAGAPAPEAVLKEVEEALAEWSASIRELGGLPKGYFTVDFQSIDPELVYCWTYGEDRIRFVHKAWENFAHRRPLGEMGCDGPAQRVH